MIFYRIISILLYPFLELFLFYRVYKKKEDKSRLNERLGNPTFPRPQGQIIWLHAVSVGEANSSLILVDEMLKKFPKISILFTTTTLTSAAIIAEKCAKYEGRVIHQFLPIDSYFVVQNFLHYWQPKVAIFMESEIWPNLIYEARKAGILSFLVNARMSQKSVKNWKIAKMLRFDIFNYFAAIFAQTLDDKNRIQQLTNQEVLTYGNLKAQAQNLVVDLDKLQILKEQIGARKIFVAASTHKGEEQIILQAFDELKKEFSDLLLVLILRHPNRASEVKELLQGRNIAQRSLAQEVSAQTEIYLVDTLGELGIFYSLNNFAFIGGSLLEIGGHNPFEAIKLNCAIISGKYVFNFKEIYANLEKADACVMVENEGLAAVVAQFLRDENLAPRLNKNAGEVIKIESNIAVKIIEKIDAFVQLNY